MRDIRDIPATVVLLVLFVLTGLAMYSLSFTY
jgi:hypothetical protein